ncbi:arginine:ornithine antiporter [Shewanella sp. NFH-SH190041]|uniref:basic amino acid/polyamine antiporter n=1 Tax=Shewanella sp. NFH-SH190041 TaxID=2950245 RepID=UPI0021C3FDBC|nr:basic amino acid/polyamine antiporter [Shewanella sp. NFH-SH190041]BDM66023.1 arginine:ornithine antiporter [Shewanella sp. NFH-SH190041]
MKTKTRSPINNKLGLGSLTALVIGSIIGAGVFSLPQNMASAASPLAVIIGWIITGFGMIFLALTFQRLCITKPEINTGVFGYAKEGFGDLIGFFSAWGYWLCAVIANVSYLVIIFSTLGLFFDTSHHIIFGEGNNLLSITLASVYVWIIHFLLLKGIKTASVINIITTIAKLIPIGIFIVATLIAFKANTFTLDLTGVHSHTGKSLMEQVKDTMLFTVWVFIGIEGAVIVSGRAKNQKAVGIATILGLLTTLSIYVLISLLSMGVISTPELANMQNPSTAKILEHILGPVGLVIIGVGLLISVLGAYLSWTLLTVESPYIAAKEKMFPKIFAKVNKNGTSKYSLIISTLFVQITLILIIFFGGTYNNLLNIASVMVLVPYLLVAAFAVKVGLNTKSKTTIFIGSIGTIYGIWLLYAAGIHNLFVACLLYLPGIIFFIYTKYEYADKWFYGKNRIIIFILIALGIIGLSTSYQ